MKLSAEQSQNRSAKKRSRRLITILFIVVLAVIAGVGTAVYLSSKDVGTPSNTAKKKSSDQQNKKTEQSFTMAAMGDMLAHTAVLNNAKTTSGYDFTPFFSKVRSIYTKADTVFCNQEGLSSGPEYTISGYPSFNAPATFSEDLKTGAGCNLVNLANNHMGDKGTAATNATIATWESLKPLALTGANRTAEDQRKISYFTKNGVKGAFLSFADFNNNRTTPGYSINIYHDTALFESLLREARGNADVVIVSMHWGTENASKVNDDQREAVARLASLGADVVIGTGPHVLQKTELVRRPDGGDMLVWYSLGNFLSAQLSIQERIGGVAQFKITKTSEGKARISEPSFTPTYMHYTWTPQQEEAGDFDDRKNIMIYPLKDAAKELTESRLGTSVQSQIDYVAKTLGDTVTIK